MKIQGWMTKLMLLGLALCWLTPADAKELKKKPNHIVYLDQTVAYDSNVVTNVDEEQTDESDTVFDTTALLELSVLPKHIENYDLRISYLFLQILHDEFDNLDFRYHAPGAKFWYHINELWALNVHAGFIFTEEDSDEFFTGPFAEIEGDFLASDISIVSFGYKYMSQDYDPTALDARDTDKHRFQVKYERDLSENVDWYVLGRLETSSADDDGFSYFGQEIEGGIEISDWPCKFDWDFSLGYRHRGYDEVYPGFSDERDDDRLTFAVGVSYPVYKEIILLGADLEYILNSSNLSSFDYDEVIVGGRVSIIL